ncbi:MarR family winged helix-turn-helix transcriptional regulator [Microbacterium sp. 18062]|uniref:MarR family winged helix-turn-helix transcriptional regulator n=1 Tax=Microbacterium sp. 18062 TaxID=2681410 RepID=UPI001F3C5A64|nr:MarR family winged helix-turn-helix transcriptional regulator [Microbacterium sp. 18062]
MTETADPQGAPSDPGDAIAAALSRLRGRRGPWRGMPTPPGGPHAMGGHQHHHGHSAHDRMPPWGTAAGRPGGGPARLRLLEALVAASGPLSVSEIGDAIGVDQPRASRLVQQGVEHGLVRREADPDDARRTRIVLTERGAEIARGFRGERRAAIEQALAALSPAEQADLVRLLTKFAAAWPE